MPDATPTSIEPPSPDRRSKRTPGRKRSRLWTAAQLVLAAVVLWYVGKSLVEQWVKFRDVPLTVHLRWGMIALSAMTTLTGFVVLIETWRRIMIAWGQSLDFATAARIWFVSNLVRYLPGSTLLQLPAMAELSRRQRLSPVAAAGGGVINTAVNIATGFIVALVAGYPALQTLSNGRAGAGIALALVALACVAVLPLLLPRLTTAFKSITGREITIERLPVRAIYISLIGNVIAWVLYGIAYRSIVVGVIGTATGSVGDYIAVYAAAYVIGYLVIVAPAGAGARELVQTDALPLLGLATVKQAGVIALVARLVTIVLEIVPGLFMLPRGMRLRPEATQDSLNSQDLSDRHGPNA